MSIVELSDITKWNDSTFARVQLDKRLLTNEALRDVI